MRTAIIALTLSTGASLAQAADYTTPQDAINALISALATGDAQNVATAIGPGAEELAGVYEEEIDAGAFAELYTAWQNGYRFVPQEDGNLVIELGFDGWPFPVPLSKGTDGWSFDVDAGRAEIVAREIGGNELDTIGVLNAYLAVQTLYRLADHDGDGVLEFASEIISPLGTRSGLYWIGRDSPLGDRVARASLDGFLEPGATDTSHEPFFGYYFRILNGQSDAAPGGAMSYMIGDNMLSGHALLAVPADYGVTGVHTFMVGEAGVIWEADLGEATMDVAFEIELFDPDPDNGWSKVSDAFGG